jgi:uncharacterized protein YecT (DUF1311 family)
MHNLKAFAVALLKSRLFIPGVALIAVFLIASRFMSGGDEGDAGALPNAAASSQTNEVAVAGNDLTTASPPGAIAATGVAERPGAIDGTAVDPSSDPPDAADAASNVAERRNYAAQPLPKPSFNCAIAGLEVERLICGIPELALLDVTLAEVYDRALIKAREYDQTHGPINSQVAFVTLAQNQNSWIRNERNKCVTEKCLYSTYKERIDYLSAHSFK